MVDRTNAPDPNKIDTPSDAAVAPAEVSVSDETTKDATAHHLEEMETNDSDSSSDMHKKAGIAVIQQQQTIPTTGKRMPTSKWEYIFFCIFCRCSNPVASLQCFNLI